VSDVTGFLALLAAVEMTVAFVPEWLKPACFSAFEAQRYLRLYTQSTTAMRSKSRV